MPRTRLGLASAVLAVLGCGLYLPFLGNPMVFDDLPFFSGGSFAHFAAYPFGLELRRLPYFTLALPQVLWGEFPPWHHAQLHRVISLLVHAGCALAFYRLLHDLLHAAAENGLRAAPDDRAWRTSAPALAGAVILLLHPAAVYGAAYLMQRTILFATLFSLLSLIFFLRGIVRERWTDALWAAACYALAVFSKEHSFPLPAVAVMMLPLAMRERGFALRYLALYWAACLPAAITVFALVRGLIGEVYEPYSGLLLEQIEGIPALDTPGGAWFVSAVTQAGLFFRYLLAWLAPSTGMMAIDIRVDFAATWSPGWIVVKLAGFAAFGALGLLLLRRRGRLGLAGFGMLYSWIMFAIEFTSVRLQEPFVLYRSYLWAPGFILIAAAILASMGHRSMIAVTALIVAALSYQAHDRLQTFSSNLSLWEDAATKLPPGPVPYGSRILFGMAREQVYAGKLAEAARTADRCIALYPRSAHCSFSRGAVHFQQHEYAAALSYLETASRIDPGSGLIHTHRGLALERLGRVDEARAAYQEASRLGFIGGDYRLGMLDEPATGGRVLYDASRVARKKERRED